MSITVERAMADPWVARVDRMVEEIVAMAPAFTEDGEAFCYGCWWTEIVKPRAVEVVGWSRPNAGWLSTSEAYDEVTEPWINALEAVDPGRGCNLPGPLNVAWLVPLLQP